MKKSFFFLLVAGFALVLVGAGCSYQTNNKDQENNQKTVGQAQNVNQQNSDIVQKQQDEKFPVQAVDNNTKQPDEKVAVQVVDNTQTWKVFKEDKIGFSLKYPSDMTAKKMSALQTSHKNFALSIQDFLLPTAQAAGIPANLYKFESDSLILDIQTQKMADMDEDRPMFGPTYPKETMLSDMEKLVKGEYGQSMGRIPKSQKLVYLFNSLYGKTYATMRQFEVCDVQLTRQLVFYRNGYAIGVTLQEGDIEKVKTQLPQYFTTNAENCGNSLIWKEGQEVQFYDDLENGTIGSTTEAGIWYKTFNQIVSSIELYGV